MRIETFTLGSFMTNCYLLAADDGGESLLIDAPEEIEAVVNFCQRAGLEPRLLVNTHGHCDHLAGNATLKKRWPAMQLAIHEADAGKLDSSLANLSLLLGQPIKSPPADLFLKEGDRIELGRESLEVLHTPGHSAGGLSLFLRTPLAGPPIAFTGDALFYEGIGRTDFPGGSHRLLLDSINRKLLTLPRETVCYAGHGPSTTIGHEADLNPYLRD